MKVSIVTISYNQVEFLEQTILSVINQDYEDIEYIIVDAGSTDGSRDLIKKYSDSLAKIIFEPDDGQAHGLNKGFTFATGEICAFLNSDDTLIFGAISTVVNEFKRKTDYDVLYGNGYIITSKNKMIKKIYSDRIDLKQLAYGNVTFIQPSLFFKKDAFIDVGGFNPENRTCWDAELLVDFALKGKKIGKIDKFLSNFRLHKDSISGSGKLYSLYIRERKRLFYKIMKRNYKHYDKYVLLYYRLLKTVRNPIKILYKIQSKI